MASTPLGHIRLEMLVGRGRKARAVEQKVRAQHVVLPDRQGGQLEVTGLIASEVNVPTGAKPVIWCLLTNRLAGTLSAVIELVGWCGAWGKLTLFRGAQRGLSLRAPATGRHRAAADLAGTVHGHCLTHLPLDAAEVQLAQFTGRSAVCA